MEKQTKKKRADRELQSQQSLTCHTSHRAASPLCTQQTTLQNLKTSPFYPLGGEARVKILKKNEDESPTGYQYSDWLLMSLSQSY